MGVKALRPLPWQLFGLGLLVSLSFPVLCSAQPIAPISITNTSPVAIIHGIPATSTATLLRQGTTAVHVDYEITSHFTQDDSKSEQVWFDGETTRATLAIKKAIAKRWDLEVVVPYVAHRGGDLDSFIDSWHEIFRLPQGGRNKTANNQLRYFYQKNGQTPLDIQQSDSGIGDVQWVLSRQLLDQLIPRREQLALKVAFKFPTGDADALLGSGAASLAAWIAANRQTQWFGFQGTHYASVGGMLLDKGEILPDQQRPWVVFGGLGSGARISRYIVLQAQLDAHSSLYSGSDFVEINSPALQLTLGGKIEINPHWQIDIGVAEDLVVHASPDVIFHLGINARF